MADFWFGNLRRAGYFPAPNSGMDADSIGVSDQMDFANGGAYVAQSAGTHREFNLSWGVQEKSVMNFLKDYRNGVHGTGLLYMVDPFAANALPPHWANPGLTCEGWPSLVGPSVKPVRAAPVTVTNLATNPRLMSTGSPVTVRTNFYSGERTVNGTGAGAALTTGVSYAGLTWDRFTEGTTTAGILRTFASLAALTNGATYTTQYEVANDGASPVTISLDWCDTGFWGGSIAPGERRVISITGSKATYDAVYRFSDLVLGANQSILIRNTMIEQAPILKPFFNGSTPSDGTFTYSWSGTPNASWSLQQGTSANGAWNSAQVTAYQITDSSASGGKAARYQINVSGSSAFGADYTAVPATTIGSTNTVIIRFRPSWTGFIRARVRSSDQAQEIKIPVTAGSWQTITRTQVSNIATGYVGLVGRSGDGFAMYDTVDVDSVLFAAGDYRGPFFDGSTEFLDGTKGAWTGTPDASTSTLARTPGNLPNTGATYTLTGEIGVMPPRRLSLIVPNDRDLWLGFTGTSTNGAVLRMRGITRDGAYGPVSDVPLLDPSGSTRLNTKVSGTQYSAIQVYMTTTLPGTATVTLVSGKAVYSLPTETPVLTGDHVEGDGHTGFQIGDISTAYIQAADGHQYVTTATKGTEIEAWL